MGKDAVRRGLAKSGWVTKKPTGSSTTNSGGSSRHTASSTTGSIRSFKTDSGYGSVHSGSTKTSKHCKYHGNNPPENCYKTVERDFRALTGYSSKPKKIEGTEQEKCTFKATYYNNNLQSFLSSQKQTNPFCEIPEPMDATEQWKEKAIDPQGKLKTARETINAKVKWLKDTQPIQAKLAKKILELQDSASEKAKKGEVDGKELETIKSQKAKYDVIEEAVTKAQADIVTAKKDYQTLYDSKLQDKTQDKTQDTSNDDPVAKAMASFNALGIDK